MSGAAIHRTLGPRRRPSEGPCSRDGTIATKGDQWQKSVYLPWTRLVGGVLLVLAGVWVVAAGPLFHRLWLDFIGVAMLIIGGYISPLGSKGINGHPDAVTCHASELRTDPLTRRIANCPHIRADHGIQGSADSIDRRNTSRHQTPWESAGRVP
jgi:hypothetical protein